jgi:hypothetical protein
VRQLRRVTTAEQGGEWLRVATSLRPLGFVSMVTLLVSGIYMAVTVWGHIPWGIVALGTILLLAVLTVAVSMRRMRAIERTVAGASGPVSPALHRLLHDPLLHLAIQSRVALALGIVFLMTAKPDLNGSLLTIGVVALLGLAGSLPLLTRGRVPEEQAF